MSEHRRLSRRDQLAEQLSTKQQKAVYLLIENEMAPTSEQKTQEELADELGISRKCLWEWRKKNQAFIEFKKEVAKDYLGDEVGLFAKALIDSMRGTNGAPSQKALDLYAKMMGFIKNEHAVEITKGNARTDEELAKELEELDALLDEVEDDK